MLHRKASVRNDIWVSGVKSIILTSIAGEDDEILLAYAIQQNRVLITLDLDFSDVRRYPPRDHQGVIVLKIRPSIMAQVHGVLKGFLVDVSQGKLARTLVILDRNKYRIRR
ncbi:MAG: DUF5615 family PIN-like protein [Chloroflexota bacterium]